MSVAGIIGQLVLGVVQVLVNGWALAALWGWFAVPIFAVPGLTLAQAIGLGMLAALLAHRTPAKADADKYAEDWLYTSVTIVVRPLTIVGIGWVATLFLPVTS